MERRSITVAIGVLLIGVVAGSVAFAEGKKETEGPHFYLDDMDLGPVADWPTDEPGLLVARVAEDSPAEKAGISRGDILLAIDGQEVETTQDVQEILRTHKAGDSIVLKLKRGDSTETVTLQIEDRLYRPLIGVQFASPGFVFPRGIPRRLQEMVPRYAPHYLHPFGAGGVLVREAVAGGPAEQAGIQKGDIIVSVDDQKPSASDSFVDLIRGFETGQVVTIQLKRRENNEWVDLEKTVTLSTDDDGNTYLGIRFAYVPMAISGLEFSVVPEDEEELPRRYRFYRKPHGYIHIAPGGRPNITIDVTPEITIDVIRPADLETLSI